MAQFGALPSFPLHGNSTSSQANDLLLKKPPRGPPASEPMSHRRLVTMFQKAMLETARLPPLCSSSGGGNLQACPESHLQPPKLATCSPLPFLTMLSAPSQTHGWGRFG